MSASREHIAGLFDLPFFELLVLGCELQHGLHAVKQQASQTGPVYSTVRRHIESARARFGVSSRLQAALRAQQSGQIEP